MEENIFDVFWEGPVSFDGTKPLASILAGWDHSVLYQIYQTHPIYGRSVLVYIGMTTRPVAKRLSEHFLKHYDEFGEAKVYCASIAEFRPWLEAEEIDKYPKFEDEDTLAKIEALLIYAHQPAYNTTHKNTEPASQGIRVFNTGQCGSLQKEVSGLYCLYGSDNDA